MVRVVRAPYCPPEGPLIPDDVSLAPGLGHYEDLERRRQAEYLSASSCLGQKVLVHYGANYVARELRPILAD